MSERASALETLEQIRPFTRKHRFHQSWDHDRRILRYGCGDENKAVVICSDGSVDHSDGARRGTKLQTSTVRRFLAGANPESPFSKIAGILREYVYLPDDRLHKLIATWVAGSYIYSTFSHFGYLFLFSDKPRCGKTRAEEVVSHLAFEATEPRNAPTPPSMRETAVAGGTVIFDTLERWGEKSNESFSAAMELLDAGFRSGGVVSKMVPNGDGEWRQGLFPVYAPYMFAAINRKSLSETALDRSFQIEMSRKSTRIRMRPYDARCEATCEPVREQLYLFALLNVGRITQVYESSALQEKVDSLGLNDRAADIWKPLLAVATVMAEDFVDELSRLAVEMSPDDDRQEEFRQLRIASALRTIAGPDGTLKGTSQQIIEQLRTVTGVDAPDLHNVLSEWHLVEKSIRLPGLDTPRKGWEIAESELIDIENRLRNDGLPSETATTATTSDDVAPETRL